MTGRSGPFGPSMASLYPRSGDRRMPTELRQGTSMGTCRWGVVLPRLGSLLGPRQTDFGALDIAAIKDALSGLVGHVDHRPVSVQPDEPAAVYGPEEAGAG